MKTTVLKSVILAVLSITAGNAQDKTTVRANRADISDNLDLRAVATLFGECRDLEDFERRLNDPKAQISNLDLNEDGYVDYLRIIETVEGNARLIVIQSVLGRDLYQDVATVEVERDNSNNVHVQVVGDVYLYGTNYIYEPIYVSRPVIYDVFWVNHYRPYYSAWYWGYYPSWYYYWRPFPVFRYRTHIGYHINTYNTYRYATTRRCYTAYNVYYGRRANAYETRYPSRSFTNRNSGYSNRYELDRTRNIENPRARNNNNPRTAETRNNSSSFGTRNGNTASETRTVETRSNSNATPRTAETRSNSNAAPRTTETRSNSNTAPRTIETTRSNSNTGSRNTAISAPRSSSSSPTVRSGNTNNSVRSNGSSSGRSR